MTVPSKVFSAAKSVVGVTIELNFLKSAEVLPLLYPNHDITFPSPTLTKANDGAVHGPKDGPQASGPMSLSIGILSYPHLGIQG